MSHGGGGSARAAVSEVGRHVEAGRGELHESAQLGTRVADLEGIGGSIMNSL